MYAKNCVEMRNFAIAWSLAGERTRFNLRAFHVEVVVDR
jgi:hypothetical protein